MKNFILHTEGDSKHPQFFSDNYFANKLSGFLTAVALVATIVFFMPWILTSIGMRSPNIPYDAWFGVIIQIIGLVGIYIAMNFSRKIISHHYCDMEMMQKYYDKLIKLAVILTASISFYVVGAALFYIL